MAESVTRYDMTPTNDSLDATKREYAEQPSSDFKNAEHTTIIWTPRFITLFSLILVIGLSAASMLAQAWSNNFFPSGDLMLAYLVPLFIGWAALAIKARSSWMRLGAITACFWTLLAALYFLINGKAIDPLNPLGLNLHDAMRCALLVSYIFLSLAYTPIKRWDTWFFVLVPLGLCALVGVQVMHRLADGHLIGTVEQSLSAKALYFSILVWWLRPSCWKKQPGPAFLFGLVPLLQLALVVINPGVTELIRVFVTQVAFICMLLGIVRLLQCEMLH